MHKQNNHELMINIANLLSLFGLILGGFIIYQFFVSTPGIDTTEHSLGHQKVFTIES
jgi:hypothetical protein